MVKEKTQSKSKTKSSLSATVYGKYTAPTLLETKKQLIQSPVIDKPIVIPPSIVVITNEFNDVRTDAKKIHKWLRSQILRETYMKLRKILLEEIEEEPETDQEALET